MSIQKICDYEHCGKSIEQGKEIHIKISVYINEGNGCHGRGGTDFDFCHSKCALKELKTYLQGE